MLGSLRTFLVLLGLSSSACIGFEELEADSGARSPGRWMDMLCIANAYELEGAAARTTGLTADSCGFVLGPGFGRVTFWVERESLSDSFHALVAEVVGSEIRDPEWVPLVPPSLGPGPGAFDSDPSTSPSAEPVVTVSTTASKVIVIDLERTRDVNAPL